MLSLMPGGIMSDLEYFQKRAEAERLLARSAAHANVAAIHEELAEAYDTLVEREQRRPFLRSVPTSLAA